MHFASTGKSLATYKIVEIIRRLYPDTYYFLASDAVDDLSDIALKFNLDYHFFTNKIGYPVSPKGYNGKSTYEWLCRLKVGCGNTDTSHVIMIEDDVLVRKLITVDDNWEIAAHQLPHNKKHNEIPAPVIELIEFFSGRKPLTNQYAAGGGSIFKVETFLNNFDKIGNFFLEHIDTIADNFYPTIGFLDCYMTVFYLLAAKDYTINPYITDTHNHKPNFDYESFLNNLPDNIEIVNNYKKWYWT